MTRSQADVEVQLSELGREPYGSARSRAVEQVVRSVEAEGPKEVLAYAYSTLVDSYVWGGEVDKAFVPFTRWVRWFDEHPEHFDDHDRFSLFWSFKWMVTHVSDYPQVPFEQIEATLQDMERRYALAGHGMNGVLLEKFRWAYFRGAPETDELYRQWTTTPRDEFANCEACDPSERALYLADHGRTEEARRLLEVTLDSGATCGTEPAEMLSQLAAVYLELGRPADAATAYRRALANLDGVTGDRALTLARLIVVLARGGQAERAVRRIEIDQRLLTEADTPRSRLQFLTDVAAAARIIALSRPELPVRLADVPAGTVAELARWAELQARELATAFDARNRTDALTRELEAALALEPAAEPIDLTVLPVGRAAAASAPEPHSAPTGQGALAGHALVTKADRHYKDGDIARAAATYVEAVALFRVADALQDAGLAEANAARCAHELEDIPGADAAYRHAIAVLRAAGSPVTLTSAVVRSWVPLALEAGTAEEALGQVEQVREEIRAAIELEDTPALRTELAESLDTHARGLATVGEHERAVALATDAAERFAALGRIEDAAHAFWLAGRTFVALGRDDDAVYHLESAAEGFGVARQRVQRGKAATDLVDALRRLGRDEDADTAAAQLQG